MCSLNIKNSLIPAFLLIIIFVTSSFASGDTYNPVTDQEISLLPYYIQVKVKYYLGMRTEAVIRDREIFGKKLGDAVYSPLHHHGLGLIYLRRAKSQALYTTRPFDLGSAISEFSFVIKNSPKYSFILYEVYCKRGETYLLMDQISNAAKDFYKSIEFKPDYFNAYILLSECYTRLGDKKNAEAVLELGRSRAAQAKKAN
jgi:tetratricopeptide (TPR) repeat protein